MKHQHTDQGIRPGVLVAVVGAIAIMAVLAWALKGRSVPAEGTLAVATSVAPAAPADSATEFRHTHRPAASAPMPVSTEQPHRVVVSTRWATPETEAGAASPGTALGVPVFQSAPTFDYRAQAAQVAEVIHSAIVQQDSGSDAAVSGPAVDLVQAQNAGSPVYQVQPGPAGGIAMTQPETGRGVGSAAAAPGFGGPSGAPPTDSSVQAGSAAEVAANPAAAPELNQQVTRGVGSPDAQVVNNAVDAYREGARLRRAYVEEMRLRRIAFIADARQREGI
jgi:hypothetical protein